MLSVRAAVSTSLLGASLVVVSCSQVGMRVASSPEPVRRTPVGGIDSLAFTETSAVDFPADEMYTFTDTLVAEEEAADTVGAEIYQQVFDEAYRRYEVAQARIREARGQVDTALALLDTVPETADTTVVINRDEMILEFSRLVRQLVIMEEREGPSYSGEIPLQMNQFIQREIRSFQTIERDFFLRWYGRSGTYIPYIQEQLRKESMPEQLAWLPFIESGFSTRALSTARALGLWQFIASTGYRYGLRRDKWVDNRMDFQHSTRAALGYLHDLHTMFGDWNTALAAYNSGEGRVMRTINRQRTNYLDDFWDLYVQLPNETARYVPRFHAVLQILKDPQRYGFYDLPTLEQPIAWDTVTIAREMSLKDIAERLGVAEGDIERINPELRSKITPPYRYTFRVPPGMADRMRQVLAEVPIAQAPELPEFIIHRVRRGETLNTIAARYRTSLSELKRANNIRNANHVRVGQSLKVPSTRGASARVSARSERERSRRSSDRPTTHVVRNGETLWSIAQRYDTTVTQLRQLNGLGRRSTIRTGQRLVVRR